MWKAALGAMALLSAGVAMPVEAQQVASGDLTLERVFASPDLAGTTPRALRLSPDGTLVTVLRNRPDDNQRFDLWAMDTSTGQWRMLVDSLKLGTGAELSEAEKMQRERARIGGSKGIVAALKSVELTVPLVVRLEGNNVDAGRETLAESGISIITAATMAEAAQKSVEAAK